jgi:membrane-associated protein
VLDAVNLLVETHATAGWVLPAVVVLAALDGFLPPVPSESVVVALAAIGVVAHGPNLALLVAAAALGAFLGDHLTYTLGRRGHLDRVAAALGHRALTATRSASTAIADRGAPAILAARYVPVGRVVVNLAAGAAAFPRRRFAVLTGLGGLLWAAYSVAIGAFAGRVIPGGPLTAALVGVAVALTLGVLVDHLLRRWAARPTGASIPSPGAP